MVTQKVKAAAASLFRKRVGVCAIYLMIAALLTGGCKMLFKHEGIDVNCIEGAKRPANSKVARWAGELDLNDSAQRTTRSVSVDGSWEERRLHLSSIGYEYFALINVTRSGEFFQHPEDAEYLTLDKLARYATKYGADLYFVRFNEPYFGHAMGFAGGGINYAKTVSHHYSGRSYTIELYFRR